MQTNMMLVLNDYLQLLNLLDLIGHCQLFLSPMIDMPLSALSMCGDDTLNIGESGQILYL